LRKRLRLEELKPLHFALLGGALFLISIIVTLAFLLGSSRSRPAERTPAREEQAAPEASSRPAVHDFILEIEPPEAKPKIHLFRERLSRWSEEQVKRYWIPLEQVALDILQRENDKRMEELFQGIP